MLTKNLKLLFIAITIFSLPLGKLIWKPASDLPMPTMAQLPFFAFLALVESAALAAGVIFYILINAQIKKLKESEQKRYSIMAGCIAWSLLNWWMHDNLHMHNGTDIVGLLYIEYIFHISLMTTAGILAYNFYKLVEEKTIQKP